MAGLSGSPSAMRRSNRRRVSTSVWDPYDESVRPQLRGKLTHEVLRQLRARMGHSEWCALTLKGAREAIAAHMRLPIGDVKQHQPTIRYLIEQLNQTVAVAAAPVACTWLGTAECSLG